jgi:SsrA-binding protein
MKNKEQHINITNRKAYHDYFIQDEFTAGIMLVGTEIKSVRHGKANLSDSYCVFKGNEMFVVGMHISDYENASFAKHDPKRDRKLLMTKRELKKLKVKIQEKGLTIVPLNLFINERGLAKLNIAVAKGKHTYDKKESIKERDIDRELERI